MTCYGNGFSEGVAVYNETHHLGSNGEDNVGNFRGCDAVLSENRGSIFFPETSVTSHHTRRSHSGRQYTVFFTTNSLRNPSEPSRDTQFQYHVLKRTASKQLCSIGHPSRHFAISSRVPRMLTNQRNRAVTQVSGAEGHHRLLSLPAPSTAVAFLCHPPPSYYVITIALIQNWTAFQNARLFSNRGE
jgi:hypothetical protein